MLSLATTSNLRDEFYSLNNGCTLARVQMKGDQLSQIVVTSSTFEGINNRIYTSILGNSGKPLTRDQYIQRREAMRDHQLKVS